LLQTLIDIFQIIASAATAVAVSVAVWQIWLAQRQARTEFEDNIDREYRDLALELPVEVFFGETLTDTQLRAALKHFFHYFALCDGQIILRKKGRVSKETWELWRKGLAVNMSQPAFQQAWSEVKTRGVRGFRELRRLEESGFQSDPRSW
jgi:hypothetical protein